MKEFDHPTPWRWTQHDARVTLVAANDQIVTEILPGQLLGQVPSLELKIALAERIMAGVNGSAP